MEDIPSSFFGDWNVIYHQVFIVFLWYREAYHHQLNDVSIGGSHASLQCK